MAPKKRRRKSGIVTVTSEFIELLKEWLDRQKIAALKIKQRFKISGINREEHGCGPTTFKKLIGGKNEIEYEVLENIVSKLFPGRSAKEFCLQNDTFAWEPLEHYQCFEMLDAEYRCAILTTKKKYRLKDKNAEWFPTQSVRVDHGRVVKVEVTIPKRATVERVSGNLGTDTFSFRVKVPSPAKDSEKILSYISEKSLEPSQSETINLRNPIGIPYFKKTTIKVILPKGCRLKDKPLLRRLNNIAIKDGGTVPMAYDTLAGWENLPDSPESYLEVRDDMAGFTWIHETRSSNVAFQVYWSWKSA